MTNLLGGHIQVASANPGEALDQLEAKRIRVLAVASERPLVSLPEVPTLRESGIDVVVTQWRGGGGAPGSPSGNAGRAVHGVPTRLPDRGRGGSSGARRRRGAGASVLGEEGSHDGQVLQRVSYRSGVTNRTGGSRWAAS